MPVSKPVLIADTERYVTLRRPLRDSLRWLAGIPRGTFTLRRIRVESHSCQGLRTRKRTAIKNPDIKESGRQITFLYLNPSDSEWVSDDPASAVPETATPAECLAWAPQADPAAVSPVPDQVSVSPAVQAAAVRVGIRALAAPVAAAWVSQAVYRESIVQVSYPVPLFFSRFFCPFSLPRFLTDLSDFSKKFYAEAIHERTNLSFTSLLYSSRQEISPVRSMEARYNQVIPEIPEKLFDGNLLIRLLYEEIIPTLNPESLTKLFIKSRKFNTFRKNKRLMPTFLKSLPEVFVSNTEISSRVSQAVSDGKLRKIASRLYTRNFEEDPEAVVRRNWYHLLKQYYPDALIADRTAVENRPAGDGSVFIISGKKRSTELPGIIFTPRKGHGRLNSDLPFINDLYITSEPRTLLENMRPSRARKGSVSRTLSREEMEEWLDKLFRLKGDDDVNQIRNKARSIAKELDMMDEFQKLDDLIGTLQGTRETELKTNVAKARKSKEPYDPDRALLFLKLFENLKKVPPDSRSVHKHSGEERANLSFFEAYFSNFIEGTKFEVSDAADIVFRNTIPSERPDDAHDVLSTFRIVSSYYEMNQVPTDFDDFIAKLKYRHAKIMAARKDKKPGQFKTRKNVAGSTQFVHPDLVKGTLRKGYEVYRALEYSFHKAAYMMFLVTEVHPFRDGNGRLARIMMNSELVSVQDQKIIIPIIYRNNYLAALKSLTNHQNSIPLIRALDFAQKFTNSIDWRDYERARAQLEACNAFLDPNEADKEGIRLRLPE